MILFNYPTHSIRKKVLEMKEELLFGKVNYEIIYWTKVR